jgi:hypothetical protein
MFGFRKRHHDEHVAKINDLADAYSPAILQGKIASAQGRLMAHHLLISCIVDQMRDEDRKKTHSRLEGDPRQRIIGKPSMAIGGPKGRLQ